MNKKQESPANAMENADGAAEVNVDSSTLRHRVSNYSVSFVRNATTNKVSNRDLDWETLVEDILDSGFTADKDGRAIIPSKIAKSAHTKTGEEGFWRTSKACTETNLLILDVEGYPIGDAERDVIKWFTQLFPDTRALIYTTWNHGDPEKWEEGCPRVRIVIPLLTPVDSQTEYESLYNWVITHCQGAVDPACRNPDRLSYLRRDANPKAELEPWFSELDGGDLNPEALPGGASLSALAAQDAARRMKEAAERKARAEQIANGTIIPPDASKQQKYALAALNGALKEVGEAVEGTRHNTLFSKAFRIGTMVAAGMIDEDVVVEAFTDLVEVIFDAPDVDNEIRAIKDAIKDAKESPFDVSTLAKPKREAPRATSQPVSGKPVVANFCVVDIGTPDKPATINVTIPVEEIAATIQTHTSGVICVQGNLYRVDNFGGKKSLVPINNGADIEGWLPTEGVELRWTKRDVFNDKGERISAVPWSTVLVYLRNEAPRYESTSVLPQYPPNPDTFYLSAIEDFPVEKADGKTLDRFVSMFNGDTDLDQELIKAFICTPFFGADGGTVPIFVASSDHGVGVGKTSTIQAIGRILGNKGLISTGPGDNEYELAVKMNDNPDSRIILIDNVKGKQDSAHWEKLITAETVTARALGRGSYERPNTWLWAMTANLTDLSTDLASRAVIFKIGRPNHRVDFRKETKDFIEANRKELIADILAHLMGTSAVELKDTPRFPTWARGVLAKSQYGNDLINLIKERTLAADSDAAEAAEVRDALSSVLLNRGWDPASHNVMIPTDILIEVIQRQLNRHQLTTTALWRYLAPLLRTAPLSHCKKDRVRLGNERVSGLIWGPAPGQPISPLSDEPTARVETLEEPTNPEPPPVRKPNPGTNAKDVTIATFKVNDRPKVSTNLKPIPKSYIPANFGITEATREEMKSQPAAKETPRRRSSEPEAHNEPLRAEVVSILEDIEEGRNE